MPIDYKKIGLLSTILALIVGSYWIIRPVKDALFVGIVGSSYLSYVKMVSVLFLIPLILLYSKLVDIFEKRTLIYLITIFYGFFFLFISLYLAHPIIGVANTVSSKYRLLGWLFYVGTDSFISLVYTLFWSFVSSFVDTVTAKRSYPLIFAGAQVGTIIGPEFAKHATVIGMSTLVFIASCVIFLIPLVVMFFCRFYFNDFKIDNLSNKTKTGFFEGLRLLLVKPYLMGIFIIASFGTIIATIFELRLVYLAKESYVSIEKVTEFLGLYGQSINFSTLIIALFGTHFIIKKFGLMISLLIYPIVIFIILFSGILYSSSLWTLFIAMIVIKCLGYAFNNPIKEIMYIPTSTDIKFKSKGWIDAIGDQVAKGFGGGIGLLYLGSMTISLFGFLLPFVIIFIWIIAAIFVGKTNNKLIQTGDIIK